MSRVNLSILAIFLIALFAISSQAADMTIMVGKGNTLTFTPQNGTVAKGDVITFMFVGGTHSVLLADTAATKCNMSAKIANPKIAGPTAAGGKNATYTVTGDIAKIWYYCGVPGHCDKGMWGLLSLATGTPSNSTSTGSTAPSSGAGRVEFSTAAVVGGLILYIAAQLL
ncbi:17971_t:CDS:2 [Acaulospora morrowiae]|uniref:17971_t:CDS:1 n=1 Tax=Acaulospora morrowiae TaxID=94023 RepID=A0A9N9H5D5_9GLOM|nr:17971_t:CDS:2 [Acaulospora morrowiae]